MFLYAHRYKVLLHLSKRVINNYELNITLVCKKIPYIKTLPFMPNWLMFSWDFFVLTKNFLKMYILSLAFHKKILLKVMKGKIITHLCSCEGRGNA